MRERYLAILNLLREADDYVTADSLAQILHISSRSVRNDISQLRRELEQLGIYGLQSKTRNGYRLELTQAQWKQIDRVFFQRKQVQPFSCSAGG